eukprot:TRINITY_DN5539_c0_g1_i1.p1 TRINITY_DN5539_c0_g1~~TRINITY_DN5539_c0_g1_i1.p1  ORF type:complete len:566 (-),score=109.99 TRINITY_DN5539_c0_g1_i1:19-1716(-)
MKHFLVVHEVGAPIFFDHPEGNMLCPTFSATQQLLTENFGQMAKYCQVGNTVLAFHTDGSVYYCAASDEGEPYSVLKRQLYLVRDFVAFFAAKVSSQRPAVQGLSASLRPVVSTISRLARTRQSFIVQGVECVEVNTDIQGRCISSMDVAMQSAPKNVLHCLMFVNSKLVAIHSRPNSFPLAAGDIFLISIFLESIIHPAEEKPQPQAAAPAAAPVEETQSEAPTEREEAGGEGTEQTSSGRFVDGEASETSADAAQSVDQASLLSPTETGSVGSPRSAKEPVDTSESGSQAEVAEKPAAPSTPCAETKTEKRHRPQLPRQKLCYLHVSPTELRATTLYIDQIYETETSLHTVVMIVDGKPEQLDEGARAQLNQAKDVLATMHDMVNLRDFLRIKEHTHFSMISYLELTPGLVHFVFVDRCHGRLPNRVMCPSIRPLCLTDQQSFNDESSDSAAVKNLTKLVWESVYHSQELQEAGYQESLRDMHGLQCHHKVWMEDEDGTELAIDPTNATHLATMPYAFRDRAASRKTRCYELYAVYLGMLSAQAVAVNSRKLIHYLLDKKFKE